MTSVIHTKQGRLALIAVLLLAPVPSIGVWFAAYADPDGIGPSVWALAKIWLFVFPVLYWRFVQKQPTRIQPKMDGLLVGAASGGLLAVIIIGSYWLIARPMIDFGSLRTLMTDTGIQTVNQYLMLVLYLTFINSLIEEYVFRWFLFEQLSRLISPLLAVGASGLIFMGHHTLVLTAYIPWQFNLLASLGVLTGGLLWSWLYYRYDRVWPAYLSHIGADIGVFVIGYDAVFVAS